MAPGFLSARHGDEGARLGLAVGMRHAGQHLRHMAIVGEGHELRDVAFARRAHDQALGNQLRPVNEQTFVFAVVLLGNHGSPSR